MKKCLILTLLALVGSQNAWPSAYGNVSSGNSLYNKTEYDKSLDKYREAQMAAPDNPVVYYNIGDALHKTGKYDESTAEFSKTLNSKNKLLRSKAYYNMGNNAYAQEKPEEAINYYKKCLDLNPKDMDAKYNLEFLLNQKNMPKQKNKDGKNDKNKDQKQQNSQASKDNGKDKQDKDKKNSMSKEDAQRILQYYDEQEKRGADKRKMNTPEQPKTDEDW